MQKTISFRLDEEHLGILDRLAKEFGSRSQVLRNLLDEVQQRLAKQEMEHTYRMYFAQGGVNDAEENLTEELLAVASWPDDGEGV